MKVERLHIAEFIKYSDKQCKGNSGNECQEFRGAFHGHGHGHEYHVMIQGLHTHDASGCKTDMQPEYEKC
jgi:hypothetical protein